jgi:hypothetical protein
MDSRETMSGLCNGCNKLEKRWDENHFYDYYYCTKDRRIIAYEKDTFRDEIRTNWWGIDCHSDIKEDIEWIAEKKI